MNRRRRQRVNQSASKQLLQRLQAIDWKQAKPWVKDHLHRTQRALVAAKAYYNALPLLHRRLLPSLGALVLVLLVVPWPSPSEVETAAEGQRVAVDMDTRGLSQQQGSTQASAPVPVQSWTDYVVKSGDTLSAVFRRNDLATADLNALVQIEGSDKPLSQIKQGQLIRFKTDETGQLDILQLEHGDKAVMFFRLSDGTFGRSK